MSDPTALKAAPEPLTAALPEYVAFLGALPPRAFINAAGEPLLPPIDVDVAGLGCADAAGCLSFTALRNASGGLVGACLAHVARHPHYAAKVAVVDLFDVLPGLDAPEGIVELCKVAMADLRARGASIVTVAQSLDRPHSLPLSSLGFVATTTYHSRPL